MAKKKKALVEVEFDCPLCAAKLRAVIHRKRLNPTEPPVYDIETEVEAIKQEELFPENEEKPKTKRRGRRASISAG